MGRLKLWDGLWAPYMSKYDWGAQEEKLPDKWNLIQLPISHVWFTYDDIFTKYQTTEHIKAVQMCQKAHMDEGEYDIKYNFLVNAEGVVYEGREWSDEPYLPERFADLRFKCLNIAYIGDFSSKDPSWSAVRSGMQLVMLGLKKRYISGSFKIIGLRE